MGIRATIAGTPAIGQRVRIRGAGVNRSLTLGQAGRASAVIHPRRAGRITVSVLGCSRGIVVRPAPRAGVGAALTGRSL